MRVPQRMTFIWYERIVAWFKEAMVSHKGKHTSRPQNAHRASKGLDP